MRGKTRTALQTFGRVEGGDNAAVAAIYAQGFVGAKLFALPTSSFCDLGDEEKGVVRTIGNANGCRRPGQRLQIPETAN